MWYNLYIHGLKHYRIKLDTHTSHCLLAEKYLETNDTRGNTERTLRWFSVIFYSKNLNDHPEWVVIELLDRNHCLRYEIIH